MSGNIYHSWNGTVLTITSDSGTSSADLKGSTGIRGAQGIPGIIINSNGESSPAINASDFVLKNDVANMVTKDELSSYATKEDISNMAVKDDLTDLATKTELNSYATKEELTTYATKTELNSYATKDELNDYASKAYVDDKYTYGTSDLTANESSLASGVLYFVYE